MKVIWLCNIVLKDFSDEFQLYKNPIGGWMEALWYKLRDNGFDIEFVFPIIDEWRMKNGTCNGTHYYSVHAKNDNKKYCHEMSLEYKTILKDSNPDIIHIWGTEWNHSRAMVDAAMDLGMLNRVVIRIQGLISRFGQYYAQGVPEKYIDKINYTTGCSIKQEIEDLSVRSESELYCLKKVKYISGRGDWDRFYVKSINKDARFFEYDNLLRKSFYKEENKWNIQNVKRHTIFIGQGYYPLKGLHIALKAVGILKNKYKDINVTIGGVNPLEIKNATGYADYINEIINTYSIDDNVIFAGRLSEAEMIEQYRHTNVSVSPSMLENKANCIMESMLLGVPTVATFVGGNVGVIRHGVDGFTYPALDYYMLAGYIDEIFTNDTIANNISKSAQDEALEKYNPDKALAKVIRQYNTILEEQKI